LHLARERIFSLQGQREAQKGELAHLAHLADQLADDDKRGQALLLKARFGNLTGDYNDALDAAAGVVRLAQAIGAPALQASGHFEWGAALWRQGRHVEARRHSEQALLCARAANAAKAEAEALRLLGNIFWQENELAEADRYYQQSLSLCRQIGDRQGETRSLSNRGIVALQLDRLEDTRQFNEEALQLSREMGFRGVEVDLLNNLAVMYSYPFYRQLLHGCLNRAD
jgi:tetratricopeptide (TPR) repeat protein